MTLKNKHVTVLGAGIGGLTVAIALARRGAVVTVLEQAPALREVGAGLQITPNGSAVLTALDLAPQLRAIGVALQAVELCDYRHGQHVMRLDMAAAKHGNANPYLLVHRADLVDMLAEAAQQAGVSLIFGQEVTAVVPELDQALLVLADGTTREAGLLIGADGLRSLTRQALNVAHPPDFTGQVAWRATVETSRLVDTDLSHVARVYMGPGRHLVTYPLRGGRLINIVAVQARKDWVAEGWNHLDDPKNLQTAFSDFAPAVTTLLKSCDKTHLWGLFAHPVADVWSSGVTAILGDACHPTLPFLAQGANMALEDAWVLAAELDRHVEIAVALAAYRGRRVDRVRRIVSGASANTRIYHLGSAPVRSVVHQGMRVLNRFAGAAFARRYDWLYGTDVTKEA